MISKLKKIDSADVEKVVVDKEIANEVKKTNEPVLMVKNGDSCIGDKDDELIKIEVAVRKCDRVGVFDN